MTDVERPTSFLSDGDLHSMNGTFYPTGHLFAMFADAATAASFAEQMRAWGSQMVRVASPQDILVAFAERADEIKQTPPSVGREEQFSVKFVELARAGQHGVLARAVSERDAQVKSLLGQLQSSAAYGYGTLVIEELVEPSRQAVRAAPEPT